MKHNENNNRDATLGGGDRRSNFTTINYLRIRARLAVMDRTGQVLLAVALHFPP